MINKKLYNLLSETEKSILREAAIIKRQLYLEFLNGLDCLWESSDSKSGDGKSTNRSKIDNDSIEKALKKKSEDTGVPLGVLRAVMRRGMAAWKSGHRPGAGQEQWGYARVNSFLTKSKGTWGGADSDLAKEVRDAGKDKGMKESISRDGYYAGLSDSTKAKKKRQMKKQADMDDDDPDAYEDMPGDVKGRKTLKTSKHTKRYHELYGDD
jgi:hypothetical protein